MNLSTNDYKAESLKALNNCKTNEEKFELLLNIIANMNIILTIVINSLPSNTINEINEEFSRMKMVN